MTFDPDWKPDGLPELAITVPPTEAAQNAVSEALQAIKDRSYSGRHPELGKMVNCVFCGIRHRENERKCEQKFVVELTPPEGLTNLTARQTYGAAMFNKRRQKPRTRPTKPLTKWQRIIVEAHKRKHAQETT